MMFNEMMIRVVGIRWQNLSYLFHLKVFQLELLLEEFDMAVEHRILEDVFGDNEHFSSKSRIGN